MTIIKKTLVNVAALLLIVGTPLKAQETVEESMVFPEISFWASLEEEQILDALSTSTVFTNINKENIGSPIRLTVAHRQNMTSGGAAAGMASAILAGSTLGLLPVVENKDHILTFAVRVHGNTIAKFEYEENFTDATNMYNLQNNTASKEMKAWIADSVKKFIVEVQSSSEVIDLLEEYQFYFGELDAEEAN